MSRLRKVKSKAHLYKRKKKKIIKEMSSKSEKLLLDSLESIYGVKIERQYQIRNKYFDGRFAEHILEIDGIRWHSSKNEKLNDLWKNEIARTNGFKIHRITLNRVKDVPKVLEEHKELFKKIFT